MSYASRLLEEALLCTSEASIATCMGLASMIRSMGIHDESSAFVLTLIQTNNDYVLDALFSDEDPFLLLRNTSPSAKNMKLAFSILSSHNPGDLHTKALIALLGMIEIAYKHSRNGFDIYPFTLSELNNLGKYLEEDQNQFAPVNIIILRILDNLHSMGSRSQDWRQRMLAFEAMQIRLGYFDRKKRLVDIIPEELMTKSSRRESPKPNISGYIINKAQ